MLSLTVVRSSSDGNAISYVLRFVDDSRFHVTEQMGQISFVNSEVAAPGAKSAISDCIMFIM